jgi:hypothetical protein
MSIDGSTILYGSTVDGHKQITAEDIDGLEEELENYVLHTEMPSYLSPYLLVSTYNTEQKETLELIGTKLDTVAFNNTISNYSTTTQTQTMINTSLIPYFTKTEINSFDFKSGSAVSSMINSSLVGYYTQQQINDFQYQTLTQQNTAISSALIPYYNASQIDNFGFRNSAQVNTAINNAISHLATVDGTNQEIINALLNHPTNASLQDTLTNYVLTTFLTSNYSTTTHNNSTFKTISSFNSDIGNYYTKVQSDGLYHPLTTNIIPFTTTGNPAYTFKIENLAFQEGGQTFRLGVYDNNNLQTSLIMGNDKITTPGTIQGITALQFSYLNSLTGNVQNQINLRALITDLTSYKTVSSFNTDIANYTNTQNLLEILQQYATIASLSGFVPTDGHNPFDPTLYYNKTTSDSRFLKLDGTNTMTGSVNSSSEFPTYFSRNGANSNKFVTQISDTEINYYIANPSNGPNTPYMKVDGNNNAMVQSIKFFTAESNVSPTAFECMRIEPGIVRIYNELNIGDTTKNIRFHKTNVAQIVDFKNNKMFFRHLNSDNVPTTVFELATNQIICHKELSALNIQAEDVYAMTLNLTSHNGMDSVLYVDAGGVVNQSNISSTVLGHLSDVSSNIQTQLNNKLNVNDTIILNNNNSFYIRGTDGSTQRGLRFHAAGDGNGYIDYHNTLYFRHNDGNENMVFGLNMNNQNVWTALPFNNVSYAQFQFLTTLTSNVQTQLNDRYNKTDSDARYVIRDVNNNVNINFLLIESASAQKLELRDTNNDANGFKTNISFVATTDFAGIQAGGTKHNTMPIVKPLQLNTEGGGVSIHNCPTRDALNVKGGLNLENLTPWDSTNYLRFIQNHAGGNGEFRLFPSLDSTNSIAEMHFRFYASGTLPSTRTDIITLYDSIGGGVKRTTINGSIINNGTMRSNSSAFIHQTFDRLNSNNLNFGVGSEYRLSDVLYAQTFGGKASDPGWGAGYYAIKIRNAGNGTLGSDNWWDSPFYVLSSGCTLSTAIISGFSNANTDGRSFQINGYGHVQIKHPTIAGNNRLFITESGNVGIGMATENITNKFTVKATYDVENSGIMLNASDPGFDYWMKMYPYVIGGGRVGYKFKTNSSLGERTPLTFYDTGSVDIQQDCSAGNFTASNYLITSGTQTAGGVIFTGDITEAHYKISIAGAYRLGFYRNSSNWGYQAYVESNGAWVQLSDRRAKDDIEDLNPVKSLEKILQLTAKHYVMRDSPHDRTKKCVGFISQEVEEVIPEAVSSYTEEEKDDMDERKMKCLNYNDIFIHNVNATKTLYGFIQKQNDEINTLRETVRQQNETLAQVIELLNNLNK